MGRKNIKPEFYEIEKIEMSTPDTHVSVERLLSGLRYVYSDIRSNLVVFSLKSIVIVQTNYEDNNLKENVNNNKK